MIFRSVLSFFFPKGIIFEKRCQTTSPLRGKNWNYFQFQLHLDDNLSAHPGPEVSVFALWDPHSLLHSRFIHSEAISGVLLSKPFGTAYIPFCTLPSTSGLVQTSSPTTLYLWENVCGNETSLCSHAILKEKRSCICGSYIRNVNILIHVGWKKTRKKWKST